ncbi:MAG: 6-bladed beta-propeller [Balneolaceae bacterium]
MCISIFAEPKPCFVSILCALSFVLLQSCTSDTKEGFELILSEGLTIEEINGEHLLEVSAVTTNSTGDIIIADWRAGRIHVMSSAGEHIASFGEAGAGTGRYQAIGNVFTDPDNRLFVVDYRVNKNDVYEHTFELNQTVQHPDDPFRFIHSDGEGHFLIQRFKEAEVKPGLYQEMAEVCSATITNMDYHIEACLDYLHEEYLISDSFQQTKRPFSKPHLVSVNHEYVLLFNTQNGHVTLYDHSLKPLSDFMLPIPSQEITNTDMLTARMVAGFDFLAIVDQHIPTYKPAATKVILDQQNRIWVKTHDTPPYKVFSMSGEKLGEFDLPLGFDLIHIHNNIMVAAGTVGLNDHVQIYDFNF